MVYEWRPAERWRKDYTRIVAVILYQPAVKRRPARQEISGPAVTLYEIRRLAEPLPVEGVSY